MKRSTRAVLVVLAIAALAAEAFVVFRGEESGAPVDAAAPSSERGSGSVVLEGSRATPSPPAPGAAAVPGRGPGALQRLRVRVTSIAAQPGSPLPGARIDFTPGGDEVSLSMLGRVAVARRRFSPRFGVPRTTAVTDAEGRAGIDVYLGEPGRLSVVAEGFATEVRKAPFPVDAEITVAMRPGLPIAGMVVETGTGFAPSGMSVYVSRSVGTTREVIAELVTDPAGRFRSDAYPLGEELTFDVVAADGRTAQATAVVPAVMPAEPLVRLEIPGRGRCAGVVLGIDGKPVEHAVVRLVPRAAVKDADLEHPERWINGQSQRRIASETRGGVTGPDGAFVVSGLAFETEYVAFAAGGVGSVEEAPTVMPVPALPVSGIRATLDHPLAQDVRLRLRRHGTLRVRVTDDEGAPVRTGRIELAGTVPSLTRAVPRDGSPAYFWIEPGRATVRVMSSLAPPVEATVDVPEGKAVDVAIVVPAGARVDGAVVDREGKPVAKASVELTQVVPEGVATAPMTRTTLSDDEGHFEIGSLERTRWRVLASSGTATTASPLEVVPPARGLRLLLVGHGRVVLRLLAKDGAVPADVEVRRARGDEVLRSTAAVEAGRVELDGFDGTPETVEVIAEGFAPVRFEVTVGLGETRDLGTMTLSGGEPVAGVVVDARGDAVPGAAVVAGHHGRTFADEAGRFSFRGLPAGPLPLVVGAEGFLVLERSVTVGGPDAGALRLVLSRGARVRGVVLTERGEPAEGVRVALVPLDGEGDRSERTVALRTDEDGSFEVRVTPGRWRIDGGEGDRVATLGEVVAIDGETHEMTLVARAR